MTFFIVSIIMILVSIVTCIFYKAYKNTSSLTLIGLQVIMWIYTGLYWGLFYISPPWF